MDPPSLEEQLASTPQQQIAPTLSVPDNQEGITITTESQQIMLSAIPTTAAQQQGITVIPKLQQIISATVQKPQMVGVTPKLQQIVVAGSQGGSPSSKLQQIINAAVQQPGTTNSPQLQRIITNTGQGLIATSQLQQMINAGSQSVGTTPRFQQIVVTTSQLQHVINTQSQLQNISVHTQSPKSVTTSTAVQGVIATPLVHQGKPVVQQNIKTQMQQGFKTLSTQHAQTVKTTAQHGGTQLSQVQGAKAIVPIQGMKTTQLQHGGTVTVGGQLSQGTTTQGLKTTSQLQQIVRAPLQTQSVKVSIGQGTSTSGLLQQGLKVHQGVSTPTKFQGVKVSTGVSTSTHGVKASPQAQKGVSAATQIQGGKTASQTQQGVSVSTQQGGVKGVTASPQLQQVVKGAGQVQQGATAASQGAKASPLHQQGSTQTTSSQGVKASPQLQQVSSSPKTKTPLQGVTATPRLQQMVSTPSKKHTSVSSLAAKEKAAPPPKPTNLGELIGKLSQGSRHVKRFKEDRRNIVKVIKPLNYGAFGSYAPSYDSSFANLSKDESDLINGSYTEFEPSAHIKSIISKDTDYTFTLADNLIDILSGGGDSKRIKLEKDDILDDGSDEIPDVSESREYTFPKTEDEEMETLSSLGIDLSHLSNFDDTLPKDEEGSAEIQQKLEHTTNLIKRLQQMQYDRLSVTPHPRLGHTIQPPSDSEMNLATEITGNLTNLAKQVPPGALVVDRVCTLK